jgi:hypothetical protein
MALSSHDTDVADALVTWLRGHGARSAESKDGSERPGWLPWPSIP